MRVTGYLASETDDGRPHDHFLPRTNRTAEVERDVHTFRVRRGCTDDTSTDIRSKPELAPLEICQNSLTSGLLGPGLLRLRLLLQSF